MDAVLLEKAETQQMLVLLRKENETLRHQREVSWSWTSLSVQHSMNSFVYLHTGAGTPFVPACSRLLS